MGPIPKSWSPNITRTLLPNNYTPPNAGAMSVKMKQEQGGEKKDKLDKAKRKKLSRQKKGNKNSECRTILHRVVNGRQKRI